MAKAPRRGKSGKSAGAGSRPPARSRTPVARSLPRTSGATYEIICSECYNTFDMNPASTSSSITCPECLHVGERGDR